MREHWKRPERRLWRIVYHPIAGMTSRSAWHIEGTHWRVRTYPDWVKLEEFDKSAGYEINAVALAQNYGVIDFYVYRHQKVESTQVKTPTAP
ncbi:MAG: hypothetical protein C0483_11280 [Pirellula sp.]|nr:hypothetical protein [Pirellula sp.]